MPFITEEMYCHLPGRSDEDSLLHGPWPDPVDRFAAPDAVEAVSALQEIVGAVRNLRADYGIDPAKPVAVVVARAAGSVAEALQGELEGLLRLGRMSSLDTAEAVPVGEPGAHAVLRSGAEVFLPLAGVVDLERERERTEAEIDRLRGLLEGSRRRLEDSRFVDRAPTEVVEREREKCSSFEERLTVLVEKREAFGRG
jgi:valyl-tRNA synthetase